MEKVDLTLIIACYNEEKILEENVKEIKRVMTQTIYSYEIIFVDDCSKDKTRDLIKKITTKRPNMRYIFHEKNVGRGGAVVDGIKIAKGKIVGFLDIDLEVHARYIPSMVLAINNGNDVTTAYRIYKTPFNLISIFRHITSIGYRKLVKFFLHLPLKDTETGFKFFNREKILPIVKETKNKGWFWDTEIMALSYHYGLKIKEIPCLFIRQLKKKSTIKPFRDSLNYFIRLIEFTRRFKKFERK